MKYSNIVTGIVTALILSACDYGSGSIEICEYLLGCYEAPPKPPPSPATVSVHAGFDQTVTDGDTVQLTGTGSHSHSVINNLTFEWSQIGGPAVTLFSLWPHPITTTQGLRARFVAPPVTIATTLTFRLTATASDGLTNVDLVDILVEPTSASALCLQAPLFAISYAWTNSGCTTDSADIAGDSRTATVYRQGEAEPNDSLQLANPLTFPMRIATERMATDVTGSISGMDNDNDDFFIFTPPETGIYQVYLCNDPLVCIRGTVAEKWFLSVSDQNLRRFKSTRVGAMAGEITEQFVTVQLDAGLPYYVGIHVWDAATTSWDYNLTILSGSN